MAPKMALGANRGPARNPNSRDSSCFITGDKKIPPKINPLAMPRPAVGTDFAIMPLRAGYTTASPKPSAKTITENKMAASALPSTLVRRICIAPNAQRTQTEHEIMPNNKARRGPRRSASLPANAWNSNWHNKGKVAPSTHQDGNVKPLFIKGIGGWRRA